jgi:hypothetical protein
MPPVTQEIGQPVPPFALRPIGGDEALSPDLILENRKGALLVFWSAVCSHCRRYDGYFNSFTARHPQIGFTAIASRSGETREAVLSAIRERDLNFPILIDEGGVTARAYFAQQTPRCYLIGPDRALLYRGAIDNFKMAGDPEYLAYLEPAIAAYVAGEPIPRTETASFGCAIETVYYRLPGQL